MSTANNTLLRIGVFYDGTYFSHVSNYYLYQHERKSRLSISGIHEFIRDEISRQRALISASARLWTRTTSAAA